MTEPSSCDLAKRPNRDLAATRHQNGISLASAAGALTNADVCSGHLRALAELLGDTASELGACCLPLLAIQLELPAEGIRIFIDLPSGTHLPPLLVLLLLLPPILGI